jgi:hypothetical protein
MPWTVMSVLQSESVASPEAIGVVSGDCHASRQGCPGETGRGARAHRGFLSRSVRPRECPEAAGGPGKGVCVATEYRNFHIKNL